MAADELARNIDAYDAIAHRLEQESVGKWAVFQRGELVGIYATREDARQTAEYHHSKHSKHPPYVRPVGPLPIMLPSIFGVSGRVYADN